ncbi:MAG TPA: hypothetical protein VMA31_08085 [Bryobacteraceae bacterium]|nr:hypothetical protein [Bryobacteraceae bacterium]
MLQNPIIQLILMLLGAYTALHTAEKYKPADTILLALAAVFVIVLWLSRYSRDKLANLHKTPGVGALIDLVLQVSGEPPMGGAVSQPAVRPQPAAYAAAQQPAARPAATPAVAPAAPPPPKPQPTEAEKLLLKYDGDFATAGREIRRRIIGHDDVIRAVIDQIRRSVQLRINSPNASTTSPLGVFIFAGRRGLGKRSLAIEIGSRMFKGGGLALVDVSDPNVHAGLIVAEALANPYTTFILDKFEAANERMQNDLLSIVSGAPVSDPKTGVRVSFRNTLFFLLIQGTADRIPAPSRQAGGTGQTMVVNTLADDLHIDKRLAWSIHGVYPFLLPPLMQQAEIIAALMENSCRKYNLQLGHVDASVLAREVEMATQAGGFELAPPRIEKLLNGRILEAVNAQRPSVAVTASAMETHV